MFFWPADNIINWIYFCVNIIITKITACSVNWFAEDRVKMELETPTLKSSSIHKDIMIPAVVLNKACATICRGRQWQMKFYASKKVGEAKRIIVYLNHNEWARVNKKEYIVDCPRFLQRENQPLVKSVM